MRHYLYNIYVVVCTYRTPCYHWAGIVIVIRHRCLTGRSIKRSHTTISISSVISLFMLRNMRIRHKQGKSVRRRQASKRVHYYNNNRRRNDDDDNKKRESHLHHHGEFTRSRTWFIFCASHLRQNWSVRFCMGLCGFVCVCLCVGTRAACLRCVPLEQIAYHFIRKCFTPVMKSK